MPWAEMVVLGNRRVPALRGGEVEVQGGCICDKQRQRRQTGQRCQHLDITATALADQRPVPCLLTLRMKESEPLVVAVAAEWAPQPRHLPARCAQSTAQEPRLIQTAKLSQQRPAATGRTAALLPDRPVPQFGERLFYRRE